MCLKPCRNLILIQLNMIPPVDLCCYLWDTKYTIRDQPGPDFEENTMSKQEERKEIEEATKAYLAAGGKITKLPTREAYIYGRL